MNTIPTSETSNASLSSAFNVVTDYADNDRQRIKVFVEASVMVVQGSMHINVTTDASAKLTKIDKPNIETSEKKKQAFHYIEQRFKKLVEEWKSSRRPSSSAKTLAEHPAYLEIISMGKVAIPLILKELESNPDHWFVALYKLTGESPVPEKSRGKIKEMAKVWVSWGKQKGYI